MHAIEVVESRASARKNGSDRYCFVSVRIFTYIAATPMTSDTPSSSPTPGVRLARSRPDLSAKVSPAQLRVLELLLDGHTEPQVGEILGRSRHTVHDHTKAIYAALGVTSRVQLVLLFSAPR
jgi:DNA-binding NarL/FixJ family response regulator